MASIFLYIYDFMTRSLWRFLLMITVILLPLLYLASRISFEENIERMLPESQETKGYQEAVNSVKILDKIIIRVELIDSTEEEQPQNYASELVETIQQNPRLESLIKEINYKIPEERIGQIYDLVNNNLPLYLNERDYQKIDSMLSSGGVKEVLTNSYRRLISPASLILKNYTMKDPLNISAMGLSKFQTLQIDNSFYIKDGYIYSKNDKNLYILISHTYPANDTKHNLPLINTLDTLIQQLNTKYHKKAHADQFGASIVAAANAEQIQTDIIITLNIALGLIIALIFFIYRKISIPFLILSPAVFGMLFSLAFIYVLKGKISVLALGAGSVVLGIAIDYAFHVVIHYMHSKSIKDVIKEVSTPLLIGCTSTVAAFLSLLFVKSQLLYDFGLFSGLSLIGAVLFSLIFLPPLIKVVKLKDQNVPAMSIKNLGWLSKFIQLSPEKSKVVVFIVLAFTVVFIYYAQNVSFEEDLSKMNYMTPDLKRSEAHYFESDQGKERNLYLLFKGSDLNEALHTQEGEIKKLETLKRKGAIVSYSDVSQIIASDAVMKRRISDWETFWTPAKKSKIKKAIEEEALKLGFKPMAFEQFYNTLDKRYDGYTNEDLKFLRTQILKENIIEDENHNIAILSTVRVRTDQGFKLSSEITTSEDSYLLDKQYFYTKIMNVVKDDFNQIQLTSSILVFIILLISFGRIETTLIAYIPMVISWVWILGIMGMFDIRFNIVNVIICTFIFGIGDDYSIFFVDGLEKKYKEGKNSLHSYKNSIFLTSLTTIIGMGALIFAQHPALNSIAVVSVIGILCVLIISYTLIPLFYKIAITNRTDKGLAPLTITSVLRTLWVYFYFVTGALLLTVVGWLVLVVMRLSDFKKVKYAFRYCITLYIRSLLGMVMTVKKVKINLHNEEFDKPGIIIANHQSFLDILLILALHPKILLITNNWVWNSPIFGKLVRMIGFYNAEHGAEGSIDYVKNKIEEGYSIAIFPEGTRSEDGQIKRFHKGAFYIAETLKLDIIPIVFHGTGEGIKKGDFILNRFPLTMKILPRVVFNTEEAVSYQENTKQFSKYFRAQYEILKEEKEIGSYYYKILSSYIYKGPVLEWYYRIKVKLESSYQLFDELLPKKGKIYDIGCGYGFMSYFLAYKSEERELVGIDYDESKIMVAANSYLKTPKMSFSVADANTVTYAVANGIVISDVLHYMQPETQVELIKNCIKALHVDGTLIIRDGDSSKQNKHKFTKLTEMFSTQVFKFNIKKQDQLFFISSEFLLGSLSDQNVNVEIIDNSKYSSNIIYRITKK